VIKNDLELLKKEGKLTPDLVFRDPYLFQGYPSYSLASVCLGIIKAIVE
jgi:hypothetical protein